MTANQYKAAIKRLGLTQVAAGRWLGISPRQSQSYAIGEYPVPEPVAKLLRLCISQQLDPEEVR
jgi:hypothetical protein